MDSKIARIQNLKDEVKDLHPLLHVLFKKLPDVLQVNLTHGPNEKGADFIVVKSDQISGTEEYIGAIVKSGDIRQNFDDVERQIKECSMPRTLTGGRKKIVISEIWVVCSGIITSNAQDKINHEYADKKIKFIWSNRLVDLIDQFYPEYWENIDNNIGVYLGCVSGSVDELMHRSTLLDPTLADFYVDQDLSRIDVEAKRKFSIRQKAKNENLSDVLKKERFVVVEAPMGYGKSRLLRQCARELASSKSFSSNKTLPVFITFRDAIDRYDLSIESILDTLQETHQIPARDLKVILFVDGVDEINISSDERSEKLCQLVQSANGFANVSVVLATRPFNDPNCEKKIDSHAARFALQPLSAQRIIKFVERICSHTDIASRLKKDLERSDLFKSLPRSPISAILLGRVLSADAKELPSSLPELYAKYLELASGRWDIQKGNGTEKDYETIVIILRLIAQYMLDNDLPSVSIDDAKSIAEEYLGKRHLGRNSEEVLNKILSRSEVIVSDQNNRVIFFRHRSFAEFMYADLMYTETGKGATLPSLFDSYWGAVIYFYLGRLRDCPDRLKEIFSCYPENDRELLVKLLNSGSYLLAAYQSPYIEIENCVRSTISEAAKRYCEICEAPDSSPLGKFPEIHLLCIFTGLLKNAFEYDFFSDALMRIETDFLMEADISKESSVAAFFVAAIRAGLGAEDAFTSLVGEHYAHLPQTIRLGVEHAAKDAGLANDAVKKVHKKMSKSVKSSSALRESLRELYDVPLTERKSQRLV